MPVIKKIEVCQEGGEKVLGIKIKSAIKNPLKIAEPILKEKLFFGNLVGTFFSEKLKTKDKKRKTKIIILILKPKAEYLLSKKPETASVQKKICKNLNTAKLNAVHAQTAEVFLTGILIKSSHKRKVFF